MLDSARANGRLEEQPAERALAERQATDALRQEAFAGPQSRQADVSKIGSQVERVAFAASGPFVDVSPEIAFRWLNTPAGKAVPPIAERFEAHALRELGPEAQPDIYVSKTPGDRNLPPGARVYGSINEAVRNAAPGSVIQVGEGVYNEQVNLSERQSNLVIQTDRQNPAVISGGGFRITSGSHDITVRNFDIRNFSGHDAGIRIDGSDIHDITIAGNNVHDARGAEGIAVYGRPGVPVSRITIAGNRIHDLKLGELEALPINGNVDGFTVTGNSGYRLDNLFIDAIGGEGNGGNRDQARNGVIAFNFADGISSKGNNSYSDYSAAGIYSDAAKSLNIYGNYVRNSDYGIEIGSEHGGINSSNMSVHDNILEKSHLNWLKLGYKGGVDNSTIENNLVLNNSLSDVEREGPVEKSVKVGGNIGAPDFTHVTRFPAAIADLLNRKPQDSVAPQPPAREEGRNQERKPAPAPQWSTEQRQEWPWNLQTPQPVPEGIEHRRQSPWDSLSRTGTEEKVEHRRESPWS